MTGEKKTVVIIGAGALGVANALLLDRLGYKVTLVDDKKDIMTGASRVAFIWHDGAEYLSKTGDFATTLHCVDGLLTLQQLFPPHIFRTAVASSQNPVRFLMSKETQEKGEISLAGLLGNAQAAKKRYAERFALYRKHYGVSDLVAAQKLLGMPSDFNRNLEADEFADLANIVGGIAGSASGINMPVYYAYMKALLEKSNVIVVYDAKIEKVEKSGGGYKVITSQGVYDSDRVIVSSGQNTPQIIETIDGAKSAEGCYFLNCMSFVTLPKTSDTELQRKLNRINFTLRDDGGCSFICAAPPTATEDGLAASYYPTLAGNQIRVCEYRGADRKPLPEEFNQIIKHGLPEEEQQQRKQAILGKLYHLYPFLRGYIGEEHINFRYGSVFSQDIGFNEGGTDRSIRPLTEVHQITEDGKVIGAHGPKMTNIWTRALQIVGHIREQDTGKSLPVSEQFGYGPTNLDVTRIVDEIGTFYAAPKLADAIAYAREAGLPERMIFGQYQRGINWADGQGLKLGAA